MKYIFTYLLYSYQKEALFDVKTKVYAYHIFSSNCNVFENVCMYVSIDGYINRLTDTYIHGGSYESPFVMDQGIALR